MVFPQRVGPTIKLLGGDLKENPGSTHLDMITKSELHKNDTILFHSFYFIND